MSSPVGSTSLKRSVQFAIESSAKDALDSGQDLAIAVTEHFPLGEINDFTPTSTYGMVENDASRLQTRPASWRGVFEGNLSADWMVTNMRFLYLFLPSYSSADNTTYYTHTLSESTTIPYGAFFAISPLANMDVFAGCVGQSLTLTIPKNDKVSASATFEALEHARVPNVSILTPSDASAASTGEGGASMSLNGEPYRFTDGTYSFSLTLEITDTVDITPDVTFASTTVTLDTDTGKDWVEMGVFVDAEITFSGTTSNNSAYTVTAITDNGSTGYFDEITISGGSAEASVSDVSFTFSAYDLSSIMHEAELGIEHSVERGGTWNNYYGGYFTYSDYSEYTFNITVDTWNTNSGDFFSGIVDNEYTVKGIVTLNRGTNDKATFTYPKMHLYDVPLEWEESIRTSLEFIVHHDDTSGYPLQVSVEDVIGNYDHAAVTS